ncbi:MAG: putative cytokinetic ring protein SteA [Armatimonadetes bacterium]|nr:putative cytokinetic ring protein SteA [Armatimonadota bacterium]
MVITGTLRKDKRTKNLVRRLRQGDVALIAHADLDPVAAEVLVQIGVAAVINTQPTLTGRFPTTGALLLLQHNIPIVEAIDQRVFDELREGKIVTLDLQKSILRQDGKVFTVTVLTEAEIRQRIKEAEQNLSKALEDFVENTLTYLRQEGKQLLTSPIPLPPLRTRIANRHALIVVRGHRYREDLLAIRSYIRDRRPVLIGVDGGADALLELGYKPDIIVGDMDSVSEEALRCGAELIVHAYPDGRAPGAERVRQLGLTAHTFPVGGTSEDAAMILAYEAGAELLVAVGTHSSVVEFLEKGRKGMASTFLTRLKVGHKLVDAKGVSALYTTGIRWWHIFLLFIFGTLVGAWIIRLSPTLQIYLRPLWLWLQTSFEHLFMR